MFTYSLSQIPFTRSGSFLTISAHNPSGSPRLFYKTCSGRIQSAQNFPFQSEDFFELALIKEDREVPYTWQAYPYKLVLSADAGEKITLVFYDNNTLLFRAENVGLKMMPCKVFPAQYSSDNNQYTFVDWYARGFHNFRSDDRSKVDVKTTQSFADLENHAGVGQGTITFEPKDKVSIIHGEIQFSRHDTVWDYPFPDFDDVILARKKEISTWMKKLPAVPEKYLITAETAWFLLWNCQVSPEGALPRPAIYMSKSWMNGIWAWDNLFNALAVVSVEPNLAWDQLLLFCDHQVSNGMFPDMITDLEPIYGFTKPPIQGWAIQKLIKKLGKQKSLPYLHEIYTPLSKLTSWWYTYRDFDKDGMPVYIHGNDSGWDNSTVFDQGLPVKGADLAAYLVLQCECLGRIAGMIGKKKAALRWRSLADDQLNRLLSRSVKNDHFFSPKTGSQDTETSQSLINYIPLILGKRLPEQIRNAMVVDLQPGGPYLTPLGLATEPPTSAKYLPDGYWRGPIWGASTYLIVDGLIESGEPTLARMIAERFCDLCMAEPGFWENYDALSGKGLRCPGYSWTASVFLLLAEWLENTSNKNISPLG